MKRKMFVLVPIIAVVATLGYVSLQPGPDTIAPPSATAEQNDQLDSASRDAGAVSDELIEPASVIGIAENVDRLIQRGFIPEEYRDLWLDPDYERIAEQRFNVIPKVATEDGEACVPLELDESELCWNEYGYHPYLTYDLDTLRQLASTEAAAAEALSFRLPRDNVSERLHFSLQASRLSGKSGPIMRFAYTFVPDESSPHYLDQMLDRYAIALAGEALGYPYRLSRELELQIQREFDLSREDFREALRGRRVTLRDAWGDQS